MSNLTKSDKGTDTITANESQRYGTELRMFDKVLITVGLFFINFVTAMDTSATNTVQPRVLSDFNAMTKAGAISVVMYLLSAGFRPVYAKISSVFGHLQALALAVTLHTLGSLICSIAQSFAAIFAGTVLSGLGQAGYSTLVAVLIADILPIHLRASVTAYISVPFVTNYYLGIEIGNRLYNQWHWVYGILCILAVVCSIPVLISLFMLNRRAQRTLHNSESTDIPSVKLPLMRRLISISKELDLVGLLLLCGGLMAVLSPLGLQLNNTYGWGSAQLITPLVIGVLILAGFIYYEARVAAYPVVPLRLLKIRTFACAIMTAMLFFFSFNASLFFFTPYIQVTRDVSARTAMLMQQGTTGYFAGLFIGGWAMQLSKRYRRWVWMGWSLSLVAACLMLRARGGSSTTNAEIAVVQAMLGVAGGVIVGCAGIGVQASVSKADLSIAITLYSMVEYVGGVLGEAASTTIWVNVLPTKLEGRVNDSVDINSAINNITYYLELPRDQQIVVQNGYIATQKLLTICGICAIGLVAVPVFGLAPYDLSANNDEDTETKSYVDMQ